MTLDQSAEYPLLMRAIHQAEDLCESASHAAYHLRKHPADFELHAVEAATSQAGYLIRRCGKGLEAGYNESNWFDVPTELSESPRSKALLDFLLSDLKRAILKINKAISYLADYEDCREELRGLRKAKACLLGSLLSMKQCYGSICFEIRTEARQETKTKAGAKS